MKPPITSISTTVRKRTRVEVTGDDILQFLRDRGMVIPKDAGPYVQVPGGGDWSNMALDLDSDTPVVIEWETTEEE